MRERLIVKKSTQIVVNLCPVMKVTLFYRQLLSVHLSLTTAAAAANESASVIKCECECVCVVTR